MSSVKWHPFCLGLNGETKIIYLIYPMKLWANQILNMVAHLWYVTNCSHYHCTDQYDVFKPQIYK